MMKFSNYIFLHFLVCFIVFITSESNEHISSYLGCYQDRFHIVERDLIDLHFLEESMSISKCERLCGSREFQYFGLQYSNECRCGNKYGKYGIAQSENECNMHCDGQLDAICGGPNRNSIYKINFDSFPHKSTPYPFPWPNPLYSDKRPLIGLVMMVKDEGHTLPQTLAILKPYIEVFYFLDTGSTDDTIQKIHETLPTQKVFIFEEPFIDYGTSRNRALELTAKSEYPPIFSFMLSADETVYNMESMYNYCLEHRDASGPNEEGYSVVMDVGWKFDSLRLSRTDADWRYVGRVHEYLAARDGKPHSTQRVPNTWIKFTVTDPARRSKREYTILKILLEEKRDKPNDHRTSFYLARTYNTLQNHSAALEEFRRRVSLGGWHEEVYESLYAIAWQIFALGKPWEEVEAAFIQAHVFSPDRSEPLYNIAEHYFNIKQYSFALMYAQRASQIKYPVNCILWVQSNIYKFQAYEMVSRSAFELGLFRIGLESLLLAMNGKPKEARLEAFLSKYENALGSEKFSFLVSFFQKLYDIDQTILPNDILNNKISTIHTNTNTNAVTHFDHNFKPDVPISLHPQLQSHDDHWTSFQLFLFFCINLICFFIVGAVVIMWKFKRRSFTPRRYDNGLQNLV